MNSIIITEARTDDWAYNEWIRNGIHASIMFKSVGKIARAIRRVHVNSIVPFKSIWLGKWKKSIKEYDMIIIHISSLSMWLPLYINRINPDIKVIVWYWNSVTPETDPRLIKGKCEKWSFDPENCKQFGMKFNHQYYFKSLIRSGYKTTKDVFFCGSDSGRGEDISRIYKSLKDNGLKVDFRVVYPQYEGIPDEIKSKRVSYSEILLNTCSSKAILELVRNGQSGSTIRVMEALFQGRKLITNNERVQDEPFFDRTNIFILNQDNISEISDFLDTPPIKYNPIYIDDYDVCQWMNRFSEDS